MITIGERLRAARGNMTQEQLAKALGTGASTIAMWENNLRVPRDNMKVKIAKYFNKSIVELFY